MNKRLVPENWYKSAHRKLEELRKSMKETPSSLNCDFEEYSRLKEEQLWMFIYEKLHDLEDLEEELGIELAIFIKAVLVGFYYKDISSHNIPYIGFARGKRIYKNYFRVNNHPFYFKDYGKTWALTKEELL